MKSLILFTIGPVQSFISQARKTHDLYAGSLLLTDLINAALDYIGDENLIFPYRGVAKKDAMPNRFLAWVPTHQEKNLEDFGRETEQRVRERWQQLANQQLDELKNIPKGFHEQIANHLEIFWAIEPVANSYHETLSKLEKQLAGIKNIRTFQQFGWQKEGLLGEIGRKCSLDGQRNIQFYFPSNDKKLTDFKAPLYTKTDEIETTPRLLIHDLKPGEGLSAVSYLKRKYLRKRTTSFLSTAEVALKHTLDSIQKSDPSFNSHISFIQRINPQLFYDENIKNDQLIKYLEEAGEDVKVAPLVENSNILIKEKAKKLHLSMSKYYALITFDGDNMGKWLSGEYLNNPMQLEEFQKDFAKYLSNFAGKARKILDGGRGQTVYAGGDDFLGFVSLSYLLTTLQELRILFKSEINDPISQKYLIQKPLSFSAGICVAHYKEPLTLVLQEAKKAQEIAKNTYSDKNAFSIIVVKGSGESHIGVFPFGQDLLNPNHYQYFINQLKLGYFSTSFIKNLRSEFDRIPNFTSDSFLYETVFTSELARFLKRASSEKNLAAQKELSVQNMLESIMKFWELNATENFFQILHIADFFQREIDILDHQN